MTDLRRFFTAIGAALTLFAGGWLVAVMRQRRDAERDADAAEAGWRAAREREDRERADAEADAAKAASVAARARDEALALPREPKVAKGLEIARRRRLREEDR